MAALAINLADGVTALLRFRSPMLPGLVDALAIQADSGALAVSGDQG